MPSGPRPTTPSPAPDCLSVRFWGVRGSVAVPGPDTVRYGGNTSCVEARWGGDILIFDAGTGIRELGKSLAKEFAEGRRRRLWILITHTHWDHIQGFPFFAPAYLARQHIRILGGRGSRSGLRRTVAASIESPFFPVSLPQMPSTISVEEIRKPQFRIGRLRARVARIHHPGGGVAFRIDTPAGSMAYVPDHEILTPTSNQRPRSPVRTLRAAESRNRAVRELIQGVDLLIHDSQYTTAEYATRVGWGHSCVDAVLRQASEAKVRQLVLFHHDPDRTDNEVDAILAQARIQAHALNPDLIVDAAREGLQIELRRPAC